jgi:hypothetical protein
MPFGRVGDGSLLEVAIIDMGAFELQDVAIVDGDFNDDGNYDCLDINALAAEIAAMTHNPTFDLTSDGLVNGADLDAWLVEGGMNNPVQTGGNPFLKGDANLDGVVDGSDFGIWNSNKFTVRTDWCSGNFNADGVIDGSDFNIWNSNKFTSSMPRSVPSTWCADCMSRVSAWKDRESAFDPGPVPTCSVWSPLLGNRTSRPTLLDPRDVDVVLASGSRRDGLRVNGGIPFRPIGGGRHMGQRFHQISYPPTFLPEIKFPIHNWPSWSSGGTQNRVNNKGPMVLLSQGVT